MNQFNRGQDPMRTMEIGKRALYFKLKPQSIIKLVNTEGFDPTMRVSLGDLLLIDHIDKDVPVIDEDENDPDRMEINYYIIDKDKNIQSRIDSWIIDPDFFAKCFEVIKL